MPYTIQFNGLACFIRQTADDSYLVALPDGRNAKDPRTGTPLPRHDPYIVAVANDIQTSDNWPATLRTPLAFFPIDPGATVTFENANIPGGMDTTQYDVRAYRWSVLDAKYDISPRDQPPNAIALIRLRQGTFRLYRIPKGDSLIVQVDIQLPAKQQFYDVTLRVNGTTRKITLSNDSEIVVANTSGGIGSLEDFFIYYQLNTAGYPPSGTTPEVRDDAPRSTTRHPYLHRDRDLHVSCSPVNLP